MYIYIVFFFLIYNDKGNWLKNSFHYKAITEDYFFLTSFKSEDYFLM